MCLTVDAGRKPLPSALGTTGHLVLMLSVTDINATAAAIKAAGGSMEGEPVRFGAAGMMLGFAVDPAGNRLELIQPPKP
jgi:predicted enzyme related to lactoylglutathione lyase